MVDAVTSYALELKGNIAKARSTFQKTSSSAVAVCLLVQRLKQSDALPCWNIEGLLDNYDPHPGRVLDNILPEYEFVTRHSVADNQMIWFVGGELINGTISWYGVDSHQSSDQKGQTDYILLCRHFDLFHTRKSRDHCRLLGYSSSADTTSDWRLNTCNNLLSRSLSWLHRWYITLFWKDIFYEKVILINTIMS